MSSHAEICLGLHDWVKDVEVNLKCNIGAFQNKQNKLKVFFYFPDPFSLNFVFSALKLLWGRGFFSISNKMFQSSRTLY